MKTVRASSLLEALMACCLFAVAFLILLGVFPLAAGAVRQGSEVMAATFLAEQQIEAVRALPYDSIADATQSLALSTRNNGVTCVTQYTIATLVTEIRPGLKGVRVLVTWEGQLSRHLELMTYVAKLD